MADFHISQTVDPSRIQELNGREIISGRYVLYWMQQSQRGEDNPALELAIEMANRLKLPVLVAFGLTDAYPDANLRHFAFMLEGLRETRDVLKKRGITLTIQLGEPPEVALKAGRHAAAIVCDRGYLRHQKAWRERVARKAGCRVVQVEGDVIVPVEVVSEKREYAARTIRPKIHKQIEDYLGPMGSMKVRYPAADLPVKGLNLDDPDEVLGRLRIDTAVGPVTRFFKGGATPARKRFQDFLDHKLQHYDTHSNQPQTDDISGLSPYLHFGQISPLSLALDLLRIRGSGADRGNVDAFLEQLIVRRELAMNFAHYTPDYDAYSCIPAWAGQTLEEHATDTREYLYSKSELEAGRTHDPYWNAAMAEMRHTGFMHNYMRMYWGKKILEWSRSPREAFQTTLELNNRYFLDGRDPNSYTGVAWIYGVHDRAWTRRPIFGKVRYMAASGLERKCDIRAYLAKVDALVKKSRNTG